jgi:hypothetical protein
MSANARSNPTARRNRITTPPRPVPGHEAIAQCAQGIWEAEGRPEGRAHEHWLLAEAQLAGHPYGSRRDKRQR